jgi:hypothetical protein
VLATTPAHAEAHGAAGRALRPDSVTAEVALMVSSAHVMLLNVRCPSRSLAD